MKSDFIIALENQDIAAVSACPKSDLHNHSYLGGNKAYIEKWSGKTIQYLNYKLKSMDEMHKWVNEQISPVIPDNSIGREKAIEAALIQAKEDGVTLLDCGDDVWAQCFYDNSPRLMTESLRQLHHQFAPDIEMRPVLGISRHCQIKDIIKWIEPFLDFDYYKSIDLYGDENSQSIENFGIFHIGLKVVNTF